MVGSETWRDRPWNNETSISTILEVGYAIPMTHEKLIAEINHLATLEQNFRESREWQNNQIVTNKRSCQLHERVINIGEYLKYYLEWKTVLPSHIERRKIKILYWRVWNFTEIDILYIFIGYTRRNFPRGHKEFC